MGITIPPLQKKILEILNQQDKSIQGILNKEQLKEYLLTLKGSKFIGICTATHPKMRKTGNPFVEAIKLATAVINVNIDYEGAVNRSLVKQGEKADFTAGSNWHEPVFDAAGRWTPFCRHRTTGDYYLRGTVRSWGNKQFLMPDGSNIAEEVIKPFLQVSAPREVDFHTFKLDSIRGITSEGQTVLLVE